MGTNESIVEQRDRFLAFAFATSDLLLEVDGQGRVAYALGAVRGLTGVDETMVKGRQWTDFFVASDKPVLDDLEKNAKAGKRCGPFLVTVQDRLRGLSNEAVISAIRVPDHASLYVSLSFSGVLMHRIAAANRDEREASRLPDKEAFAQSAQALLKDVRESGQEVDMTLVDITADAPGLKDRVGEGGWEDIVASVGALLRSRSIDGQSATEVAEGRFGILHDGSLGADMIQQQIEALSREADPSGAGMAVKSKSVEADLANLTDREAARAMLYTLNEFERNGTGIGIASLSDGFKGFVEVNAKKIQQFKMIVQDVDFSLHFQPIVSLHDFEASHYEILTRFGDGGSPYEWITFGEDVGLAMDFDLAVCKRTIDFITGEQKHGVDKFAMNISGQSIQNEQFFTELMERLSAHESLHERLIFEITESTAIINLDRVNVFIRTLQGEGYKVCLDDFGAGSASFQYLHSLYVDYVKLDGSYTRRLLENNRDVVLVKNLVRLCKDLEVGMIAEHIENEEELKMLKSVGIGYGQGYWFAEPGPEPEYEPTVLI